jgi:lipoprotein-anchoring transpeptidase ErfK/SrfK
MIRKILLSLFSIVLGVYVGTFLLPYHLSFQKPLEMNKLTGLYNPEAKTGEFLGQIFASQYIPPNVSYNYNPNVLGAYRADKRIEVDLTNQKLYAFEGNNKIYDFPISSGLWGKTPTGEFSIWVKLRYVKMEGGNKALGTYYNLPNVPYTMFFYNNDVPMSQGFGIHGTYWHHNFGHPMSHGCINMQTDEAEKIYNWAQPDLPEGISSVRATNDNPSTRVVIYGNPPNN